MKKNAIALFISIALAVGNAGGMPVYAADNTIISEDDPASGETTGQPGATAEQAAVIEGGFIEEAVEGTAEGPEEKEVIEESTEQFEEEAASAADGNVVDSGTIQNAAWRVTGTDDDLTLTISGEGAIYTFARKEVPWYSYNPMIRTVVIGNGITTICAYAFEKCENLVNISVPDSIDYIYEYAFYGCESLTDFTIPGGVTNIGHSAFATCSSLKSIDLPDGVTSIEYRTFGGCTSLTNVTIPNSVQRIGDYAFSNCSSLETITIPDGVTMIGNGAFNSCTGLKSIDLPDGVTIIREKTFSDCTGLTSVDISGGTTNIETNAFYRCTNLESIGSSDSLVSIGDSAFENCSSLKAISLPQGFKSIGEFAFNSCSSLTDFTIPDGVNSIGYAAFAHCDSLTSLCIPGSLTGIDKVVFAGCSNLKSVTFMQGVKSIDYQAFHNCKNLTSVTMAESMSSIGEQVFAGCSNLESVMMAESVSSIGKEAFANCISLKEIIISGNDTEIGKDAFKGCSGLKKLVISEGVKSIGEQAFYECSGLTSITIPGSVTSIGSRAFEECSSLNSVTISEGVTEIMQNAFIDCKELSSVFIPSSVTTIGWYAFNFIDQTADVFYGGSEDDWASLAANNSFDAAFEKAVFHFNCSGIEHVHRWDTEYTVDKEPTYTEEGSKSIHCSICGEVKEGSEVVIPKLSNNIGDLSITGIVNKTHTGKEITQKIVIKDGGKTLAEGADYTVSYKSNVNVGIASVEIKGTGSYVGTAEKTFAILPAASKKVTIYNVAQGIKVTWLKVEGATKYYIYRDGKQIKTTSGLEITDGEVRYSGGKKFTYSVVATAKGVGDSVVSRTGTYYRLMPVGIKALTNPSAGKMTVRYDKSAGSSGYVVRYGEKSDMSDAKVIVIKGQNTLSRTFGSMKKGKTYYVQVRTYKLDNGVRYYSGYCTTKTIRITK